jgi:hypothetical protein
VSNLTARLATLEAQRERAELAQLARRQASRTGRPEAEVLAEFEAIGRAEARAREWLGTPAGVYNPDIWTTFLETVCRWGNPDDFVGLSAVEMEDLRTVRARVAPEPIETFAGRPQS